MDIAKQFTNFVFGMECLGCGSASVALDPWLCATCRAELEREALETKFPTDDAVSLFPMRSLTRRMIHALKYKNISGVASYLVRRSSLQAGGVAAQFFQVHAKPFFFVPVPLHRSRFRERGYNQAEKIAAALASATGGRVCRWLWRKSFQVSQTKLSREQREWNVAGAFEAKFPKKMPAQGTVFVVDDVYTTGATTSACIAAFGDKFPLNLKVCTMLFEEPATAVMDFVADVSAEWNTESEY